MTWKEQAPAERSGGKEGGALEQYLQGEDPWGRGAGGGNPWGTEREHVLWDQKLFHENTAHVVKGAR